jgi:hypothetical protein
MIKIYGSGTPWGSYGKREKAKIIHNKLSCI